MKVGDILVLEDIDSLEISEDVVVSINNSNQVKTEKWDYDLENFFNIIEVKEV